MSDVRRLAAVAASLVATASLLALGVPAPADATVFAPLTLVHAEQVTGDFAVIGNGVLVCPSAAGTPRTECLAASQRQNGFNNNRFAMEYADVDGDPATFNSSRAQLQIPAGSRITYARLSWGANREGQQCGVGAPGSYPPGSSRTQPVRLTVGAGTAVDVPPGDWTSDTTSIGYYTADADVTTQLAGLPAGAPVPITVGNVFAPTGTGCFGGWSLTAVFTDDTAGCAAARREVFVYDGHVRQGVQDAPVDVPVTGFRVAGLPARVGVTAYEGDNGQTGDQLLFNGTALADPATGSTGNFFDSAAQGQVAPAYPNNFSVDAKSLAAPAGVIAVGDTAATLQVRTSDDAFVLQSLVLSVPVPALCLQKSVSPAAAHAGDPVTWTLTLSNPSGVGATGVSVTDPEVPGCERQVASLVAGDSLTWTCTSTVTDDTTNVATATGSATGGFVLSDSASASVDVLHPALEVTKRASVSEATPGAPVTWTITVHNSGDAPLDPVVVDDDRVAGCDRTGLGPLAAGASASYTCVAPMTPTDLTNTATASGTDALGLAVSDAASATVRALPPAAVTLTKSADAERYVAGQMVTWTLTATNTGGVPLADVVVADPRLPACDRTIATLAVDTHETWTCREAAAGDHVTNAATVVAHPPSGDPVTATARDQVEVVAAEVQVDVQVDDGELVVIVEDTGKTVLEDIRVDVTGPGCDAARFTMSPGTQREVHCPLPDAPATVTAVASAQPVLGGRPAGPRIEDRDRVILPAPDGGEGGPAVLPGVGAPTLLGPAAALGGVLVALGIALLAWGRRPRRG